MANAEEVIPPREQEIDFQIVCQIAGQRHFHDPRHDLDRTQETRRPAGSEELLRIGAGTAGTRGREFQIETPVIRMRSTAFTAAGRMRLRRVQQFRFLLAHVAPRSHRRINPILWRCGRYWRKPIRRRCRPDLYARLSAPVAIGIRRRRLPVAAKIALAMAGTIADVPGSPMPPGGSEFFTTCTSMIGASLMRSIG